MNLEPHLIRLHRHYNLCSKSYDYPYMLDMISALYNITEIIDEINQVTKKVFTVTKPHLIFKLFLKSTNHIYFHLPNPIITYSTGFKGEMRETIFFPDYLGGEEKKLEIRGVFRTGNKSNEILFKMFCFIEKNLDRKEDKIYNNYSKEIQIKKKRFTQYMTDPFIHFKLNKFKYTTISRKDLIEVVANEYNARHPQKKEFKRKHKYSKPVRFFMEFKLAGLPIPAFALLHIANDILSQTTDLYNK